MSQQQMQQLRHMNPDCEADAAAADGSGAADFDEPVAVPGVVPSPPGSLEFWKHVLHPGDV
jgi:hypothetical protein